MEQAVRNAAAQHPSVAQARGQMQQMRDEIDVARAGYMPKLQAGVSSGVNSNNGQNWRPSLSVSGSQMVYDFGKTASAVDVATAGARASEAELAMATESIARDAALAFIEAQRYQALLSVAEEQLKGVRAIGELVNERATGGASAMSDREQAEARILATEATKFEVEGERLRWLGNVSYISGMEISAAAPGAPARLARACAGAGEPD